MVILLFHTFPFKQKRVPIMFNRETGMERGMEQVINGVAIVELTT